MIARCIDSRGFEGLLDCGSIYKLRPLQCGLVEVLNLRGVIVSASRFRDVTQ